MDISISTFLLDNAVKLEHWLTYRVEQWNKPGFEGKHLQYKNKPSKSHQKKQFNYKAWSKKMMKTARGTDLQPWHDLPCRLMPSKQDRIESQYFSLLILAVILVSYIFQ